MLNGASGALLKEAKIVIYYWSLCNQLLENLKNDIFNLKNSFLVSLTNAPGAPVSVVLVFIGQVELKWKIMFQFFIEF
jgi:hypothetical protein